MKKKILEAQIIQTIFIVIMLIIALLEYKGILKVEGRIAVFYALLSLGYWILIMVTIIVIICRNKELQYEKKVFIFLILLSIEILIIATFGMIVDNRVDKIEFSKHCKKTTAKVYDIKKRTYRVQTYDGKGKYNKDKECHNIYTYYFRYEANGTTIESDYHNSSRYMSSGDAERFNPERNIGDKFTLYYNTENPEDWRWDITYAPQDLIIKFAIIIIGFRASGLIKGIIDYEKEKKDLLKI